jgi:hypothetical protein
MIKSKRMKWTGYVERTGPNKVHVRFWWESQKEREDWEDLDEGGWIILRWRYSIGWYGLD